MARPGGQWRAFLAVALAVAAGGFEARAGTGGRIVWETDWVVARERASGLGRPLMLYFYGEM